MPRTRPLNRSHCRLPAGQRPEGPAVWKVIGASVPGSSHIAAGTGCEDAADWAVQASVTCLAVADGAGSRPLAHEGARAAVARVLSRVDLPVGDPADWLVDT